MTKSSRSIPVETVLLPTRNFWPWIALGAVLIVTAIIRVRLLMIPLERDEGEFAYMGQLMLQGIPPYKLAYNMKLPGTYAAYALIMSLFGQTIAGIHAGLLLINLTSTVMVFLLTKRLLSRSAAVVAAASFALLTVSPTVLGTSAHATQFVLPFALGGCLLLLQLRDTDRTITALWSGAMFGIAILMKQHAAFFVVFAALYVVYVHLSRRPTAWKRLMAQVMLMMAGAAAPFVITCLALYAVGVFHTFWFWTFTYAREYVSLVTPAQGVLVFWKSFRRILDAGLWLWVVAGLGLITAIGALLVDKKRRADMVFLVGFALFSFLCVCPGFYFRNHYFVLIMPAAGMMIGLLMMYCAKELGRTAGPVAGFTIPAAIFIFALNSSAYAQGDFLVRADPERACRMMYGSNPFPESVEIGNYIREHSTKTDTIAVIGSEPQIYFYAQRHSATGFIYTYSLMEPQKYASRMQQDMIREITDTKPRYIVFTDISTSWLARPESDLTIMRWSRDYLAKNYNIVSRSNAVAKGGSASTYWGVDAQTYPLTSRFSTFVMERKPGV
jgi:hypothetical protein